MIQKNCQLFCYFFLFCAHFSWHQKWASSNCCEINFLSNSQNFSSDWMVGIKNVLQWVFDYDENEKAIGVNDSSQMFLFIYSCGVSFIFICSFIIIKDYLPYPSPSRKSLNASANFPGCSSRTKPQSLI